MNLVNFRFETDADGIATLTWDMPERSMNVITPQVMEELNRVVDKVAGDENIKGCVIVSGKEAFSGGADSAFLAWVAHDTLGERASAVTAVSPSLAGLEHDDCRRLADEWGMAILVVEHDMNFVRAIARKVTVFHQGKIFAEESADEIMRDPKVGEIYLGKRNTVQ